MKIIIALPVYNEELVLEKNIKQVLKYCQENLSADEWKIIICNNASTDKTGEISTQLSQENEQVEHLSLPTKGKGLAWKTAFISSDADAYIFMDGDLAVELSATKLLLDGIKEGYDLVLGSRFISGAKRDRSWQRELISTAYRNLARIILGIKATDFQCGFKAINRRVRDNILPSCQEIGFFTDTELLYLATKKGCAFKDIPVDWSEYRDLGRKSRVNIIGTSWDYLIKLLKLRCCHFSFFSKKKS